MHPPDAHQVRDPPGQHPCLAGAGARNDQHGAVGVHDGLALRRVQALEQFVLAHLAPSRPFLGCRCLVTGRRLPVGAGRTGGSKAALNRSGKRVSDMARQAYAAAPPPIAGARPHRPLRVEWWTDPIRERPFPA